MKRVVAICAGVLVLSACGPWRPMRPIASRPAPPPPTTLEEIIIVDCYEGAVLTVVGTCVVPSDDPSTWAVGEAANSWDNPDAP